MSLANRHRSTERKNREIRSRNALAKQTSSYRTLAVGLFAGIPATLGILDLLSARWSMAVVWTQIPALTLVVALSRRKEIRIPQEAEFPRTESFDDVMEEIHRGWMGRLVDVRDDPKDGPAGKILIGDVRIVLSNDHRQITILRSTFADGPRTLFRIARGPEQGLLSVDMPGHPGIPPAEWSADERLGLEKLQDLVLDDIVELHNARKRAAAAAI